MTRSLEEEIMIKAREVRGTARYMASFEDLVEERIRKAREKGAFDNLEGTGKPLNLYENPFEPPEMRLAYKMLKDAGFAPYWVEMGKDVDASLDSFWREVDSFARLLAIKSRSSRQAARAEKRKAEFIARARGELENINRKIDNFNCQCPFWWLSRGRLELEAEMQKVKERLELKY